MCRTCTAETWIRLIPSLPVIIIFLYPHDNYSFFYFLWHIRGEEDTRRDVEALSFSGQEQHKTTVDGRGCAHERGEQKRRRRSREAAVWKEQINLSFRNVRTLRRNTLGESPPDAYWRRVYVKHISERIKGRRERNQPGEHEQQKSESYEQE